jgi:Secretion system C-terminal sorting domain
MNLKKIFVLTISFCNVLYHVSAQPAITDSIYSKCFYGNSRLPKLPDSIGRYVSLVSSAEHFYTCGSYNFGSLQMPQRNALLQKFDDTGNLIWRKFFGGSQEDIFNKIAELPNGDILVQGQTASSDGDLAGLATPGWFQQQWLVIIDSNGNIKNQAILAGSNGAITTGITVTKTGAIYIYGETISNDGDFTHAVGTTPDGFIAKFDANLNKQWVTFNFDDGTDYILSVAEGIQPDELIAVGGSSKSIFNNNYNYVPIAWLLDTLGNTKWRKYHRSVSGLPSDLGKVVAVPSENAYYMAGSSSFIGPPQTYRTSLDSDYANTVPVYITNMMLQKLDAGGNLLQCKTYGVDWWPPNHMGGNAGYLNDVDIALHEGAVWFALTANNGCYGDFAPCDSTNALNNILIGKLDTALRLVGKKIINTRYDDRVTWLRVINEKLYMSGYSGSTNPAKDTLPASFGCLPNNVSSNWVIELSSYPSALPQPSAQNNLLHVYPNPASASFTIEMPVALQGERCQLALLDAQGKKHLQQKFQTTAETQQFDLAGIGEGLYFVEVRSKRN